MSTYANEWSMKPFTALISTWFPPQLHFNAIVGSDLLLFVVVCWGQVAEELQLATEAAAATQPGETAI